MSDNNTYLLESTAYPEFPAGTSVCVTRDDGSHLYGIVRYWIRTQLFKKPEWLAYVESGDQNTANQQDPFTKTSYFGMRWFGFRLTHEPTIAQKFMEI